MAEYVKQHYLPAVYLQYFCDTQNGPSRRSTIWRFDGRSCTQVRVENQCFENYGYSKANAESVEKTLGQTEGEYGLLMKRLRAGHALPKKEYSLMLAVMIDFHIRNTAHQNATGAEGIAAYNLRAANCSKFLMNRPNPPDPSPDELAAHLQKRWRVSILRAPPSLVLCTSDNPAVWLTFSKIEPKVDLMLLPLDPWHVAVAYDVRSWEVSTVELSSTDVLHLNHLQCTAAERFMYSHVPFAPESAEAVSADRRSRVRRRPTTSQAILEIRLLHWPKARPSFLREAPIIL